MSTIKEPDIAFLIGLAGLAFEHWLGGAVVILISLAAHEGRRSREARAANTETPRS